VVRRKEDATMVKATKTVTIKVENVGQAFGCVGRLYSRGKIVDSTDTYPRGATEQARAAAISLASKLGLTVRG
jgi:hypothetical protein